MSETWLRWTGPRPDPEDSRQRFKGKHMEAIVESVVTSQLTPYIPLLASI